MNAYLDASVLVPLFLTDPFTERAEGVLRTPGLTIVISDWAALEVSNVVARRVRMQALTPSEAVRLLGDFDLWRARSANHAETTAADVASAMRLVRRFDLSLRGPDALHLAIAERLGAHLYTFDDAMLAAARAAGVRASS